MFEPQSNEALTLVGITSTRIEAEVSAFPIQLKAAEVGQQKLLFTWAGDNDCTPLHVAWAASLQDQPVLKLPP